MHVQTRGTPNGGELARPFFLRGFRLLAPFAGAVLGVLAAVGPAMADVAVWTMTASPGVATAQEQTVQTFTVTNLDVAKKIGCVVVTSPAEYQAGNVQFVETSSGFAWGISRIGNEIRVQASHAGAVHGEGHSVRFNVAGLPVAAGPLAFSAVAYATHQCAGGGSPLPIHALVMVSGPGPTTTPIPTVTPAAATPRPAPIATPSPIVTLPIGPTMPPSISAPALTPVASTAASPATAPSRAPASASSPSATPGTTPGEFAGSAPPADRTFERSQQAAARASSELRIGGGTDSTQSGASPSLGSLGLSGGMGVWSIPFALVGGPGLLVIAWVGLQSAAAIAWIPAVRRLHGRDRNAARRQRPYRLGLRPIG